MHAIDHTATLDGRPGVNSFSPALNVFVVLYAQKLGGCTIQPTFHQAAVPWKHRDIGDRVLIAT